jgi:uncharacterized metal-binding protein YceD (DUF177 family)
MPATPPSDTAFWVASLPQNGSKPFNLRPSAAELATLAQELGLLALRKLSFFGEITGSGRSDWHLTGKLGATVVQPCSVTLEPVTTRIDTVVTRRFVKDYEEIDSPEAEVPEDDTTEPLGAWIDPASVMIEALVLALPLYPRAPGAELGEAVFAAPGTAPMRDEDARPFAALASLRDAAKDGEDPEA